VVWDDDCDGYCEQPPCIGQGPAPDETTVCSGLAADADEQADCNDSVSDLDADGVVDGLGINPAAEESLNFVDDNCNGVTDEGTTFFDDDLDGQTEAVGDCDDDNDQVFVGATEWCDAVDNDCDGTIDNDCIDQTAPPRVIGGVIPSRFQVELGQRIEAQVLVVSNDESLTYEWYTDSGSFEEPAATSRAFWTAPENTDDDQSLQGTFPTLMVTVTDSLGQSTTGFGNVYITSEVTTAYSAVIQTTNNGGGDCSAVGRRSDSAGFLGLFLSGLALVSLRRRSR
jgi:hypothetical protein